MPAGMLERYAFDRGSTGSESTRRFHTFVFGNTGQPGAFASGDALAPGARSAHAPAPRTAAASAAAVRMRPRMLRNVSGFIPSSHNPQTGERDLLAGRRRSCPGAHGVEH